MSDPAYAPPPPPGAGQRGSLSVELALLMPVLLVLIVGGVHLGRVMTTRHRLTDAANVATRSAAIRGITDPGQVRALLEARLGAATNACTSLFVDTATATDAAGLAQLQVTVTCALAHGFGQALTGAIGPDNLTVSAAMPL
jgi:Flp pilus assembly protein TadG